MSQDCVECKRSTQFGSGLFVNRISADDEEGNVGYMCPECQLIECEKCTQKVEDGVHYLDDIDVEWEAVYGDWRAWSKKSKELRQ
mgnify:CR=1 FL=1